ncbi:S41 family peptidase, partial [Pseudoalteromonas sp.]|uniref:S41 family peptidase n=1 Tax=Pseudoalteromonas sp. TaxID=53249 RepID=UPI003567AD16
MKFIKLQKGITLALSFSMLAACGGSSSNDSETVVDGGTTGGGTTGGNDNQWVANEFKAKEDFANKCAIVRTGSDPYTGEVYKDTAGTLNDEKMWLRSWNHESYLWYNEVDDVDPANYSTPQSYFEVLKTFAKTDSGADKDNFHFYQDTAEYRERTQGGASSGYGIRWHFGSTTPPRELLVVQTEPNSPAAVAGFNRGDQVLAVDGVDLINSDDVDTLNAGLFPENDGQTHTIKVKDVFGTEKTLAVTSGSFEIAPVKATNTFVHDGKRVGYIQFDTFSIADAQTDLIEKFSEFRNSNVSELVVDLRYNGGGLLALSSQLAYMIAGDVNTNNRNYYTLKYNGKWSEDQALGFYNQEIDWDNSRFTGVDLPTVALNKVYVISSGSTCSASEALINGLAGIDLDVVLIGGQTCGKPYGFVPTDNC